jgi:hypothetical protein
MERLPCLSSPDSKAEAWMSPVIDPLAGGPKLGGWTNSLLKSEYPFRLKQVNPSTIKILILKFMTLLRNCI